MKTRFQLRDEGIYACLQDIRLGREKYEKLASPEANKEAQNDAETETERAEAGNDARIYARARAYTRNARMCTHNCAPRFFLAGWATG